MVGNKKVGLSLSGGGYRAAAFHLGTLHKLNELGILQRVDVISTISGGSIVGACFCLSNQPFDIFEKKIYTALNTRSVIKHILTSATFFIAVGIFLLFLAICIVTAQYISGWLVLPIVLVFGYLISRFQFRIFPVSNEVEKAYNKFFFHHYTLDDLRDIPALAIGATNLQTCRPFTFSKRKMGDSSYAFRKTPVTFRHQRFPIARAVAASTCVPSFFTPVKISGEFFSNPTDVMKICPMLVDGGVYDNQGIQKLTQAGSSYACDIVITSDAGNKLPFEGAYNNTFILLLRTMETFMTRIKNFQMAANIYAGESRTREVAYFSLGWDLQDCVGGFVRNLQNHHIPRDISLRHGIPDAFYQEPAKYEKEITAILMTNVQYATILANDLTTEEMDTARNVKTNLTPLSHRQLDCLMKHAGNLAELQLRLYCPDLFN